MGEQHSCNPTTLSEAGGCTAPSVPVVGERLQPPWTFNSGQPPSQRGFKWLQAHTHLTICWEYTQHRSLKMCTCMRGKHRESLRNKDGGQCSCLHPSATNQERAMSKKILTWGKFYFTGQWAQHEKREECRFWQISPCGLWKQVVKMQVWSQLLANSGNPCQQTILLFRTGPVAGSGVLREIWMSRHKFSHTALPEDPVSEQHGQTWMKE